MVFGKGGVEKFNMAGSILLYYLFRKGRMESRVKIEWVA